MKRYTVAELIDHLKVYHDDEVVGNVTGIRDNKDGTISILTDDADKSPDNSDNS